MSWIILVSYIADVLLLINVVLYFRSSRNQSRALGVFAFYLLLVFINQLFATLIVKMWDGASNLFLFHAYLVLQYIGLSLFYAEVFKSRFIHVILGVGLGIIVGQYYFIDDLRSYFNMYGIAGTQLVLILYAIYYFFHFLGKKSEYLLINIGILMYLLCSTLIFSSGSFLKSENEIFLQKYRYLWDLNIILYFLFQVLLSVNWRMRYYKTKAKLHEHIE